MKKAFFLFLFVAIGKLVSAQYKPVDNGSTVQFKIKNLGFNTGGSFSGLSGVIKFDPQHVADASFDIGLTANSVNTENGMRDDHLRKPTYFDVQKYPQIKIVSDKITTSGKGYVFNGKLTIKDHTKGISFPFTAEPAEGGYRFKGSFSINRRDFEVGGSSTISDNLDVDLNVMAK